MPPATATQDAPLVSLRGIGKSFPNGVRALAGLNIDIRPGEFVALLGPSGCGKSTALRIIAGLTEPSEGVVEWDKAAASRSESRIGYVFQEPTLMPWASVFENAELPLKLNRMRAAGRMEGSKPRLIGSASAHSAMLIRANYPVACACAFPSRARSSLSRRFC